MRFVIVDYGGRAFGQKDDSLHRGFRIVQFVSSMRTILHVDMDAFFTSVEQRDFPQYRGKPVIVGSMPGHRGVVSASSYEARAFGVRSAMPINEAYARCRHGIFLPVRMEAYQAESAAIMQILGSFTPQVEQISVDEAFLDISGTEKLWGDRLATAQAIANRICQERCLTASIGIAPNKFLAKIASDLQKPQGITEAPFDAEGVDGWLGPLPVGKIWGVGKKTEEVFHRLGIRTIKDLQLWDLPRLASRFGVQGEHLHELCRGIDDRPVSHGEEAKSISRETTFSKDTQDRELVRQALLSMAQDVAEQARRGGVKGRVVYLIYRTSLFAKHTRRITLEAPTCIAREIFEVATSMLDAIPWHEKVRLVGVGLSGFSEGGAHQTSLFEDPHKKQKWEASERAVDKVVQRMGKDKIFLGGELRQGHSSQNR